MVSLLELFFRQIKFSGKTDYQGEILWDSKPPVRQKKVVCSFNTDTNAITFKRPKASFDMKESFVSTVGNEWQIKIPLTDEEKGDGFFVMRTKRLYI